jgi:hypothetical protein
VKKDKEAETMPNGGSDCCGTCWFNERNKGVAGYGHADDPEPNFCTIRSLAIETPFWTYCANHPHHRPGRDPVPLGPVLVAGEGAGMYPREVWQPSPDTEEIRLHLLALLDEIQEMPAANDYDGIYIARVVVQQLGEFREVRAVPGLRRVAGFTPDPGAEEYGRRRQQWLIENARTALQLIGSGDLA